MYMKGIGDLKMTNKLNPRNTDMHVLVSNVLSGNYTEDEVLQDSSPMGRLVASWAYIADMGYAGWDKETPYLDHLVADGDEFNHVMASALDFADLHDIVESYDDYRKYLDRRGISEDSRRLAVNNYEQVMGHSLTASGQDIDLMLWVSQEMDDDMLNAMEEAYNALPTHVSGLSTDDTGYAGVNPMSYDKAVDPLYNKAYEKDVALGKAVDKIVDFGKTSRHIPDGAYVDGSSFDSVPDDTGVVGKMFRSDDKSVTNDEIESEDDGFEL